MRQRSFPYRVVVESNDRKYARVFRAFSPRQALNMAEQAIRQPDWHADWQIITPVTVTQEAVS